MDEAKAINKITVNLPKEKVDFINDTHQKELNYWKKIALDYDCLFEALVILVAYRPFLLVLWKNEYFIFVTLRESLLARNHGLSLLNSLFTVTNNTGMLQFEKNRLVSSAYDYKRVTYG